MSMIEFQTYLGHGMIELPKEYKNSIKGRARVIILTDNGEDDEDMVKFPFNHPYQVATFIPLTRGKLYERGYARYNNCLQIACPANIPMSTHKLCLSTTYGKNRASADLSYYPVSFS